MKLKIFLTAFTLLIVNLVWAQSGSIRGVVSDSKTGETIIGANVRIEGTTIGVATGLDGDFEISRVEPGTYTLIVSFISYKTLRFEDVLVVAEKASVLNVNLEEDLGDLGEVVVVATRETGSNMAIVSEIRKSLQVVSGISSEQIRLSQDGNAAQVMKRVSGVSIVDNKFVRVRGVDDRYNVVMINNSIAPTTQVDKRTFSFDLIPSENLDRMLIYKSASPEVPGDFAGGMIKVFTKNAPDEDFINVGFGVGIRQNTTFNKYSQTRGSSTDWLGFDSSRGLPDGFPTTNELLNSGTGNPIRATAGQLLDNNFRMDTTSAMPDGSFGIAFGKNWMLGRKRLSTVTSATISQGYQYFLAERSRYFFPEPGRPTEKRDEYFDNTYIKENELGIMSNWLLRLNSDNKIEFRNLFNQSGLNETVVRTGRDFIQRPFGAQDYSFRYEARRLYTGQLEGTHLFNNESTKLNWVLGGNYLYHEEPDFRRLRTFFSTDASEGEFVIIAPPSSSPQDLGRYYGYMNERGAVNGVNFEKKFAGAEKDRPRIFRAGYLVDYKWRDFEARYLTTFFPGFHNQEIGEQLLRKPIYEAFAPENYRQGDGWLIQEGTRPSDAYDASTFVAAGYIGGVYPVGDFNLSGGLRTEYSVQNLNTATDAGIINVENVELAYLPSLNVDYNFNSQSLLRASYGKTLNRPEFREFAPFLYYSFEFIAGFFGNPDLQMARIDNVDLRYEFYPNEGETFSVGAFYKFFKDPIELIQQNVTENLQFSYGNAVDATVYGVEVEGRKALSTVTSAPFIRNLSFNVNASLVWSEVFLGEDVAFEANRRALQGQSPYMVNAAIYYIDPISNFQTSIAYNVQGPRIFVAGNTNFPSIYELERHVVDLTVSKTFKDRTTLKFGIQDLFNYQFRFYQDSNFDRRIDRDIDDPMYLWRRGSLYSFSVNYRIK
ncbi:TonB-dependent receptor [Cecembia lonarensis]|uniref:Outer membrane cobalamin receptor protein n=1 Tax=Cecembia lonarensis (strain CCUG 58316 / KCTC 22772 / LW9) TaxID=1225176 RepID=K1KTJ4_CECL9|nr:TonB-dependent receptor [Cecembia lonarensis]EKB47510.1 Outer membrane cobalamin receptor protein [Cecembia lonarensis LW9]